MTRRVVKLAAAYLLFGLVATWAVASGAPHLFRWEQQLVVEEHEPPRRIFALDRKPGRTRVLVAGAGWDLAGISDELGPELINEIPQPLRGVLSPSITWTGPASVELDFAAETRGLPWRAFHMSERTDCAVSGDDTGFGTGAILSAELRGGLRLLGESLAHDTSIALPYSPLWPGLIANTLFYAVVFLGLHQVAAFTRRSWRRKRGRCAGCGYDLTGIEGECPECGQK